MDKTDTHKTKYKEERLYMSTNQNLMQHKEPDSSSVQMF